MSNEPEFEAPTVTFFVNGIPAPGGSKNAFAIKKGGFYTGRVAVVDAGGVKNKEWRQVVAATTRKHFKEPLKGPLYLRLDFRIKRPKSHFTKHGDLRPDAPPFPAMKPDTLKLARSTEDAMTGIAYVDDSQNISLSLIKQYAIQGGCWITVQPLS